MSHVGEDGLQQQKTTLGSTPVRLEQESEGTVGTDSSNPQVMFYLFIFLNIFNSPCSACLLIGCLFACF